MNICFYNDHHYWGQLNNTGGTRTILLSAQALRDLGHKVSVVATHDGFTWFKHPKPKETIPQNADVVVAVHIHDVPLVMEKAKGKRVAYWARPYETWTMPEHDIIHLLKKFHKKGGIVMANSSWPAEVLRQHGVEAQVVFAGLAESEFQYLYERDRFGGRAVVGCQHSKLPRKKFKAFKKLHRKLGAECEWLTFGNSRYEKGWLTHIRQPKPKQLQDFYWACDYFFAPNKLEGFYNAASQAALSGCIIVRSDSARGGMADYSTDSNSIVYRSLGEAAERIRAREVPPEWADCRKRVLAIGTRLENMTKMARLLG